MKKKSRKPSRPNFDLISHQNLHSQNPNMVPESPDLHPQTPKEEQTQDPFSLEDERVTQISKPISIEEEIENPKSIELEKGEDDKEEVPNPISGNNEMGFENLGRIEVGDSQNVNLEDDEVDGDEEKAEQEEPEGMALSPSLPVQPVQDSMMFDLVSENPPPSVTRKGGFKRKKPLHKRKIAALEKKLDLVKEKLVPIPFVPNKTLDFARHEELLRSLGLWDFVHIEFDREIRTDLVAMLLASYDPKLRTSTVNECRIKVSRADVARALKLPPPVKKDKSGVSEVLDVDSEAMSEESISFFGEFMSNWILLHEDSWMMPDEVMNWIGFIRKGEPHKVDWARVMWFMIEKELAQVPKLEFCYYASHLQWLMKSQREDLFEEEPRFEVPVVDDREEKTKSLEEFEVQDSEEQVELCLGQNRNANVNVNVDVDANVNVDANESENENANANENENENEQQFRDEDVMDFQHCKEEPEDPEWLFAGKNDGAFSLRSCNLNDGQGLESKHATKEVIEEDDRFNLPSERTNLERLASTDLLQALDANNVSYQPLHMQDHSNENFFHSRVDSHLNSVGPSVFGNACKRELSQEDGADHDIFGDLNKRMRSDSQWDQKPMDFEVCMEQMNSLMSKARMMYATKEQECLNTRLNQEIMVSQLQQQRDNLMLNLQKTSYELQRKQDDNYKLEHELHVMSKLLEGYRKALKETRRQFSEYRKLNPKHEEPLYKDVGPGGVVLSTMELERQRLAREEEEKLLRLMIEQKIMDFQNEWWIRMEEHASQVHLMGDRLYLFEQKVELLKETFAQRKMSET